MFGAIGSAKQNTSVTFTSKAAIDNGLATKLNIKKKLLPVKNCRKISKEDMVFNNLTPKIDIDPETFKVKVNGKLVSVDPAKTVSLARLYQLF